MQRNERAGLSLFESLEARRLLSAELLDSGTLDLIGTGADDVIIVQDGESAGSLTVFGVPDVEDGTVFEGVEKLRIKLGAGDDQARIDGNPLTPDGDEMRIIMLGAKGNDAIESVTAPVKIVGGRGADTLFGGIGRDKIVGGRGNDVLAGGLGGDTLVGSQGNDQLFGEDGNDLLRGGLGRDILRGGRGRDELIGGRHKDDLFGGFGRDTLEGAGGQDTFRGDFDEWSDFRQNDAFFSGRFGNNPEAVTLPSDFWVVLNDLDSEFLNDFPDGVWGAVDAAQDFMASCGRMVQRFSEEVLGLSQDELQSLAGDLVGVLSGFDDTFGGDPDSIDASDVRSLLDDIRGAMPGEVRDAYQGLIDCVNDDERAMANLTDAMRASADADLPDAFTSALGTVLLGI